MRTVPAGTFLVPMLLSALLYTVWPDLLQIGGVTEAFLGGGSMNVIIGLVTFCSGIGIELKSIGQLIKRHGVLLVVKLLLTTGLGLGYVALFGQEGIFGISALAFIVTISSVNAALYVSLVNDYGTKVDSATFGIISIFTIPVVPIFVYALQGTAGIDLSPVLNILIPLILGIILGTLDPEFRDLFANGVGLLIPIIGWKIGQTLNLMDALEAGFTGIALAIVYYVFMSPLILVDKRVLKNDGVVGASMNGVAAFAASFPGIVAQTAPAVEPFVGSATAQVLAVALVTVIVTPILTKKVYESSHQEDHYV